MTTPLERRAAIDWEAIRRRLDDAARVVSDGEAMSAAHARSVLEARARRLARPVTPPASDGALDVVLFRIAEDHYAIDASTVHAVFRLAELTPLPGGQRGVLGLTSWRGGLLLLLDLRQMLGRSATALNDLRLVLVLREGAVTAGVLADEVIGLESIRPDALGPVVGASTTEESSIRGVTADGVVLLTSGLLTVAHT